MYIDFYAIESLKKKLFLYIYSLITSNGTVYCRTFSGKVIKTAQVSPYELNRYGRGY